MPYPLITCDHHKGDPLPGYVVCVHAARHPIIAELVVEPATNEQLGTVLCKMCAKNLPLVNRVTTACVHYVRERFGLEL